VQAREQGNGRAEAMAQRKVRHRRQCFAAQIFRSIKRQVVGRKGMYVAQAKVVAARRGRMGSRKVAV